MEGPLLEARGIAYRHPGEEEDLLADLDLTIGAGEVVDVAGTSGCGKTTLLRVLGRLLPRSAGTLRLEGRPCDRVPPTRWRREVGYVRQTPVLVEGSVRENLLLAWRFRAQAGRPRPAEEAVRRELEAAGLDGVPLDRPGSDLSVGQKARLALLRTLLAGPRLLLADEPTANLDEGSAARVARRIARFAAEGGGVLWVHHAPIPLEPARSLRLEGGRLAGAAPPVK